MTSNSRTLLPRCIGQKVQLSLYHFLDSERKAFSYNYSMAVKKGKFPSLNDGDDVVPCSEDETSSLTSATHRPPRPVPLLKKTAKVMDALHKLDVYHQEQAVNNFCFKSKPFPSFFSDSCHISDEDPKNSSSDGRQKKAGGTGGYDNHLESYGPFLSCDAFHSHGSDYTEFPEIYRSPDKLCIPTNPYGRPGSESSRPSTSGGTDSHRCRKCPKHNIFLSPDQIYEEYKSKVTYSKSKIVKRYGEMLTDKFEAFELRGDMESPRPEKEEVSIEPANGKEKYYDNSGLSPIVRKTNFPQDHGDTNTSNIIYGPAAIASVSGYSFKRPTRTPRVRVFKSIPKAKTTEEELESLPLGEVLGFEIAQATDNVRYYDDDSDPVIIEILANSPFKLKKEHELSTLKTKVTDSPDGILSDTSVPKLKSIKLKPLDTLEHTSSSITSTLAKPDVTLKQSIQNRITSMKLVKNSFAKAKSLFTNTSKKSVAVLNSPRNDTSGIKPLKVVKDVEPNVNVTKEIKPARMIDTTHAVSKDTSSRTIPKSVRVSTKADPKIIKRGNMAKKSTKKTKPDKQGPRFPETISTVSLPIPSSKDKLII